MFWHPLKSLSTAVPLGEFMQFSVEWAAEAQRVCSMRLREVSCSVTNLLKM